MATKKGTASKKTQKSKQDLLYIMSNSCGWCKKSEPVVKELVDEGAKITTLDVQNPDDQAKINEVKAKYNAQCGTPFFIDAETGNQVCGFREKDVLQKWVNGEEIPQPPRPKSPPPPPPADISTASDDEIKTWKEAYEKWAKENDHLPNVLPFDQIRPRIEQAQKQRAAQQAQGGAPGAAPSAPQQVGDYKVDINQKFYYVVINGVRETVFADGAYINTQLKHQYFWRESDGKLTKVVGDANYNSKPTPPTGNPNQAKPANPGKAPVAPEVKKQIDKLKKEQEAKKKESASKSKKNKKTIENF